MKPKLLNNINRLLGFCLLIATVVVPVHAETLPESSAGSGAQLQYKPPVVSDHAGAERNFFQARTKQECLEAVAEYDPAADAGLWCKEYDGNLVFQITNQSPNVDPVDFLISLDGKRIIEKEMPFGAAHTMEIIAVQVPSGKHVILVESKNGLAKKRHIITVKDRLYVNISYWYYTKKEFYGPVKRQFKIKTSSHLFAMQ